MYRRLGLLLAALAVAAPLAPAQARRPPAGPERFAAEIAAFQRADRASPPPPCPVLFVGSSTIRRWTSLTADMAPMAALNRGFGGSQTADAVFYFDQIVTPYKPRAIVFYEGDNDIAAKKTPAQVYADFERFLAFKDYRLGRSTPVFFISIKPSKLRFDETAAQAQANARVRRLARVRRDLHYIDVVPAMLEDGKPKDIFVQDGLHMNAAGYAIWTKIVRAALSDVGDVECR